MNFLILTHVHHIEKDGKYFAYGPYVREMNIWIKHFDSVTIIAPLSKDRETNPIEIHYDHDQINFVSVGEINLTTWRGRINTILSMPEIIYNVMVGMKNSDHIHLRCPGNMGLVGAYLQYFFPNKKKTAKYAGNWDPQSEQPGTYKLQQKLISNPSFSKNMKVLVYGNWPNLTGNLLPFFTFSYSQNESQEDHRTQVTKSAKIKLLFVGALVSGKNPMLALKVAHLLKQNNFSFEFFFCGEGDQMDQMVKFINDNNLSKEVFLMGNMTSDDLKEMYKKSHFLVFLSDSEGWPKVVAESMYFGCLPITTPVSCVPYMLGDGTRGDLVNKNPEEVVDRITYYMENPEHFEKKSFKSKEWAKDFTKESFENEILKLIKNV